MRVHSLREFRRDARGNVMIVAALAAPVLLGSMGLGAEVASWYSDGRAMQNAADSAAIAAATNASADTYDDEARAVAARYGFTNGVDGVSVRAWNNVACPDGGAPVCYRVSVSRPRALLLAQVIGYDGDVEVDGAPAKLIKASAVAKQASGPREYCVVALAGSGDPEAIRSNGAPNANLTGCSVMSNSGARCTGHDLNATFGDAVGTSEGCGKKQNSGMERLEDPYANLAANVPAKECLHGFPVAPKKPNDPELPDENQLTGYTRWTDVVDRCGDLQLIGPTVIETDADGAVLLIRDGNLDLNGHSLRTSNGSGLTIVFTGSSSARGHGVVGDGTLDYAAPTTGPWAGVAMYQSPTLPAGNAVDLHYAGNSPTWNITGLVYLPKASVTFSGAVNKSSNGASCFVLVVDNVLINGTGSILSSGQCAAAGLKMPASSVASRGQLVS